MKQIFVIIVAAGSGRRFGSPLPKQFCNLAGRPLLMHTIDAMRESVPSSRVLLVLHSDYISLWHELCQRHKFSEQGIDIVSGGDTRSQSVRNALANVPCSADVYVLVHDGARPLADHAVTTRVMQALEAGDAAVVPAIPVTDSLRHVSPDGNSDAVDRSNYVAVQTPQGFRADILHKAYDGSDAATDDASLVQSVFPDIKISITPGAAYNIKITSPTDIAVAEALMRTRSKF